MLKRAASIKPLLLIGLSTVGLRQPARKLWTYMRASGLTPWKPLVPQSEFLNCALHAIDTLRKDVRDDVFGDYLEFGVSRGTSLACMHKALQQANLAHVRLFGFDSFEGLPPESVEAGWTPGDFKSTLAATRSYLTRMGVDWTRVTLVKGWFNDTLTAETAVRLKLSKASLIMIDCDIYSASREALWFCEPFIRDRAVIIFDDWWEDDSIGEGKAFSEFLAEFPHFSAESLPSYAPQARVFLVSRRVASAV